MKGRSKKRPNKWFLADEERWAAVLNREPLADGQFFYSVRTTGVYCRPACGARRPLRSNVQFHDSCEEAEKLGFRPCQRCRPRAASFEQTQREVIAAACRLIEQAEEPPSLAALAQAAGLSSFHFHRMFTKIVGLTPKRYAMAARAERVRSELRRRGSVTEAIYGAGFSSSSRFYEKSSRMLGMAPRQFGRGGEQATIQFASAECSLGVVLVAATEKGVCSILLGDDSSALQADLKRRFPRAALKVGDGEFKRVVSRVVRLVENPCSACDLPLDIRGTAFQQRVWQALRDIPAGKTATYSEIAAQLGAPSAPRAVATACAANPVAVAIPCHRVVRRGGDLAGYRWGVERKRELLAKERKPRRQNLHRQTPATQPASGPRQRLRR